MAEPAFQSPLRASPRPTAPHSSSEIPSRNRFTQPPAQAVENSHHDYNFSSSNQADSSATEEEDECTDEEMARLNAETASSRSSISSLPASVAPSAIALPLDATTPTNSPRLHNVRVGSLSNEPKEWKWRDSPFRNVSSVRSIQMRDEDDIIPYHRERSSRLSRNMSSSGSISQTKRRSGIGSGISPRCAKVKKEFPLVLLHCSLLPPVMPIKARISDTALLQALLPEEYWRRWDLLTDRITNDPEIQSRGVLIPHPKADYELLEESLLESLELKRPRLRSGHYFGNENLQEAEESDSDAEPAIQGTKCQDCGKRVVQDTQHDRHWEVKVYAANGLMRAGAWSAAWNEMEKVDVEVSVYLPVDVRREVEERCSHLGIDHDIEADEVPEYEPTEAETRRREIYGTSTAGTQGNVHGFFESTHSYHEDLRESSMSQHRSQNPVPAPTIELTELLVNYVKVLAQDKRNVVVAGLSLAILYFALGASTSPQQGVGRYEVPANVSVSSLMSIPQCTIGTVSSMSHLPAASATDSIPTTKLPVSSMPQLPATPATGSISTTKLPVSTADQDLPTISVGVAATNLHAVAAQSETSEVVNYIGSED
jgi:hypothetical protein